MSSQKSFLPQLKEGTALRVSLPLLGISEKVRFPCFFDGATPPKFSLRFPLGALDFDQVDTDRPCTVTIDQSEQTVAVDALIEWYEPPCVLHLTEQETKAHAQSRNYFRVDATARVAASSVVPEKMAKEGESWRILGDTIDLSGSGLLCAFSEPLEKGTQVRIELTLPSQSMDIITAMGHVVRCRKIEEGLYHAALHFDLIDSESQDKIMACCFELQRRYLRMRVSLERPSSEY